MIDKPLMELNSFIKNFNDIYDYVSKRCIQLKISDMKKTIKGRYLYNHIGIEGLKRVEIDLRIQKAKDISNNFAQSVFMPNKGKDNYLEDFSLSFGVLWEFCQFVRYAEKVILYNNEIDNELYVDSSLDEVSIRKFKIDNNDFTLFFELERKYDSISKETLKVIKIKVTRDFGKKMINEFIIVDKNIHINDISDEYLLYTINDILYDTVYDTYNKIMNHLITTFLEDERVLEWEIC